MNGFLQSLPWPLDFIGRNPDDPSGPKTGPFQRACFDDPGRPRKCEGGGITVADQARLDECEDEKLKGGLHMTCYFNRVHSICSADEMVSDYDKMFENGFQDLEQLQSEFESAFGDSYAMMDPTLVDLVQAAHTSTLSGPDLTNRRGNVLRARTLLRSVVDVSTNTLHARLPLDSLDILTEIAVCCCSLLNLRSVFGRSFCERHATGPNCARPHSEPPCHGHY